MIEDMTQAHGHPEMGCPPKRKILDACQ